MWKVLCALMIVASMIFAGCGSDKKAQSSSSSAKVQVETSSSGEKQATAEKKDWRNRDKYKNITVSKEELDVLIPAAKTLELTEDDLRQVVVRMKGDGVDFSRVRQVHADAQSGDIDFSLICKPDEVRLGEAFIFVQTNAGFQMKTHKDWSFKVSELLVDFDTAAKNRFSISQSEHNNCEELFLKQATYDRMIQVMDERLGQEGGTRDQNKKSVLIELLTKRMKSPRESFATTRKFCITRRARCMGRTKIRQSQRFISCRMENCWK